MRKANINSPFDDSLEPFQGNPALTEKTSDYYLTEYFTTNPYISPDGEVRLRLAVDKPIDGPRLNETIHTNAC